MDVICVRKDLSGDNSLNVIVKLIIHNCLSCTILNITDIALHVELTLKPGGVVWV